MFSILNTYLDLRFVKEFVMEMNPAACRPSQLEVLKRNGVTRLSFGIQTANEDILERINRHHVADPSEIIRIAAGMGFVINLDFILGLPGQKTRDVDESIRLVKELNPESSFWCELRCGTEQIMRFPDLPSHEETVEAYESVKRSLTKAGYRQIIPEYFTNAESMPLYLEKWWTSENSLGFGLSAFSKVGNLFSKNVDDLGDYEISLRGGKPPIRYVYSLSRKERALIGLMSELRSGGADFGRIREDSGIDLAIMLNRETEELVSEGLIKFEKDRLTFTEKGFTISSPVSNRLLRNVGYLVKLMDTAFNFIDNMPDLESFIRKNFVIHDERDDRSVVFASPDGKGIGILEYYAKK